MSARSRTAAGPRERGRSRATRETFCENPPQQSSQSFAQSHSHPFLRSLPWFCSVSPMISVLCLAELLECLNGFSSHESCVTGCHSFHRIFGSTFLPRSRHVFSATLCGVFCHTEEQRRHGRWRSYGPTVTQPLRLCRFVCVCASRPNHYHKTTAGTFHSVCEVDGIEGDAEHEVHDLSRHVSRFLFLSHSLSQDQQTTADEGTATMSPPQRLLQ